MNVEPSEFGTEGSDGSQNHGREGQPAIDAVLDDSLDNASDGHDDERDANDEVDLRECMGHREGDDGEEDVVADSTRDHEENEKNGQDAHHPGRFTELEPDAPYDDPAGVDNGIDEDVIRNYERKAGN